MPGNKIKDITGMKFGRLTAQKMAPREIGKQVKWICLCDCGNISSPYGSALRSGHSMSCGCLNKENVIAAGHRRAIHGESKRSAEYRVWISMRRRCAEVDNPSWKYYGGRGIGVCDRWRRSYADFLADMGRKPTSVHQIDRINSDGDYEPSNCRWATPKENSANRRSPTAPRKIRAPRQNNPSGVTGVHLASKKYGYWQAHYKRKYLGNFRSKEEAIAVRIAAQADDGL